MGSWEIKRITGVMAVLYDGRRSRIFPDVGYPASREDPPGIGVLSGRA
jgi:hypothetical protein